MSETEEEQGSYETANGKKSIPVKQKIILIIAVTLVIALIAFICQNFNKIRIDFLLFSFQVRIVYLMIFSTSVGVIGTLAFQKYQRIKKKKK